jgi:hypothetical protein
VSAARRRARRHPRRGGATRLVVRTPAAPAGAATTQRLRKILATAMVLTPFVESIMASFFLVGATLLPMARPGARHDATHARALPVCRSARARR